MFKYTTAIDRLLSLDKRKKVVQGGTWAGKTYGIMAVLIDWCTKNPKKKVTVVAETIPAVKEGALNDFINIMDDTGRLVEDRFNRNSLSYTFSNGTKIQFKSFDTTGKAKAAGKRDVLYINEANYISYEIADTLIMRTEGDVWVDFNPDNEFWVHTEILPQKDACFLKLTYEHNEALPDTILSELQDKLNKAKTSEYWANWCKVYVYGEIGSLEGTIFDFNLVDSIPDQAQFIAFGLDFGFTNDPTAMTEVYRYNGEIFINELIYEVRLTNSDIHTKASALVDTRKGTVADSAEPKSIEELRRKGWVIEGAKKGADSINASIDTLQQQPINITSRSINTIKEFRGYRWLKDKDGNSLNKPIDANNHSIDGIRYVALNKLKSQPKPRSTVVHTPGRHRKISRRRR